MKRTRKQTFAIVGAVILSLYISGYGFSRTNHQIVHRISVAGGSYSSHSVVGGDAWFIGAAINGLIAGIYTPLRYVELAYWHIRQPLDSPRLIEERNRKSR